MTVSKISRYKTMLLITLVVVLPISLLSWGGYHLARQQSSQFQTQVKGLYQEQLYGVDRQIEKYFSETEAKLQQIGGRQMVTLDDIREIVASNSLIDNLFIINPNDSLAYPNPASTLNHREIEFYERIRPIVEGGDIQNQVLQTLGASKNPTISQQSLTGAQSGSEQSSDPANESFFQQMANPQIALPLQGPGNIGLNPGSANSESANPAGLQQSSENQEESNSIPEKSEQRKDPLPNRGRGASPQTRRFFSIPSSSVSRGGSSAQQNANDDLPTTESTEGVDNETDDPKVKFVSGWFTWYWGRGLNLIYWQRMSSGQIVCIALERARWMSDLVGELPATVTTKLEKAVTVKTKTSRTTRIVNSNGESVYQWGDDPEDEFVMAADIPVSSPLTSWRMKVFVDPAELENQGSIGLNIILGIGASSLALIAIAWVFMREYSKELNEAARRVSFVNQVSHELRTPLTNIRMYAELLDADLAELDEVDASQAKRRLSVVESESERLSRLISNVLTFAGSQKDNLSLRLSTRKVDEVVRSVVDGFAPGFEKLNVKVETAFHADRSVRLDGDVLEQILGNLLSNVEKYAADGDYVLIETEQDQQYSTIVVHDNGSGIDRKYREKIFMPFWRYSNNLQHASGTGIGLSISRELARLHGGDLTLEDSKKGAKFVVRIKTEPGN